MVRGYGARWIAAHLARASSVFDFSTFFSLRQVINGGQPAIPMLSMYAHIKISRTGPTASPATLANLVRIG